MCLAQGPQRSDAGEARTRGGPYLQVYVVTVIYQQKLVLKFHFASSAIFDPQKSHSSR